MNKARQDRKAILPSIFTNRFIIFGVLAVLLGLLAFWRNPTYITAPNFYAEDGTVFAQTTLDKGFLEALFTPFNGYFVTGIYLLEGVAFAINFLFWGGNILDQPTALAVVSYLFWGVVCSLPALLFWHDTRHKNWLVAICVTLALMPLPSFGYAILGTIGNYKFAFLFIAFLLLVKRHRLAVTSRWFYPLDIALVLCAFTNATVYLLLPFALLRYWPGKTILRKRFWHILVRTKSIYSLAAMGVLAAVQLIFVALNGGPDRLVGYLNAPFEWEKAIEIFVERTYLFPFTQLFDTHLNNVIVIILFIGFIVGLIKIARPQDRNLLYFGLYATFVGTALFVSQRTGVGEFFHNYTTSGTDHFFYAQNWIFLWTALFVLISAADTARIRWRLVTALLLITIVASMTIRDDFGRNIVAERSVGTFWQDAQNVCSNPHDDTIHIPIYPAGAKLTMPTHAKICTARVANYIPPRLALPLAPANNNYITLDTARITQTFPATYDQLSGVSVFFSTFGTHSNSTYVLDLLDATCKYSLRTTVFNAWDTQDNAYFDIHFAPITDSKNQQYCFALSPKNLQPNKPPLALQLGASGVFTAGSAFNGASPLTEDLVFDVLYR
jgi:hypothetical protein